MAGPAGITQPAPAQPRLAAVPDPSHTGAPVATAPGLGTSTTIAATAPAPAPAPTPATTATAATAAPPPTGVPGFSYPYVVGPPGLGAGSDMSASSRTQPKTPELNTVAAPAAAARREQTRRRRRSRSGLIDPGYRYEYLEDGLRARSADEPQFTPVTASDRGAGPIGFGGTAHQADAAPVGLTTLSGNSLDDSPSMPLLPSSWSPETEGGKPDRQMPL